MMAAMQQLSAFELERHARIAANKRKLEELEINVAVKQLQQAQPAKRPRIQKPRAPRPPKNTAEPARRSGRNAGKEKPDYTWRMPLAVFEERQPRARSLKPVSRSSGKREAKGRYPAWHWGIPDAPDSAVEQAQAAAVQRAAELRREGTSAYVKGMTHSMVGGGGWLQAPQGMHADYTAGSEVVFTVAEDTHPQTGERFAYTQEKRREGEQRSDAWNVGFLQKRDKDGVPRGGYGFSNNWKGFAVDQFLHPSDFVVFGVTGPYAADMYIFRAWDFATDAQKPEGFDAIRFAPHTAAESQGCTAAAAADGGSDDSQDADCSQAEDLQQDTLQMDQTTKVPSKKEPKWQQDAAQAASKPNKSRKQEAAAVVASRNPRKRRNAASSADAAGRKKQRGSRKQGKDAGAKTAAAALGSKKQRRGAAKAQQQQQQKQAVVEQQEEEEFTVDWILDTKVVPKKLKGGTTQEVRMYKVRWLGYDEVYDSWEPAEMFDKPVRQYDWGTLQADGIIKRLPKANIPKDVP